LALIWKGLKERGKKGLKVGWSKFNLRFWITKLGKVKTFKRGNLQKLGGLFNSWTYFKED